MSFNPNIHHRKSIRLKWYDYTQAGLYFITICLRNHECLFGNIKNGEMILNNAGNIANNCWLEIPNHYPNARLHEYVIMPNHIHGIIELAVGANNHSPVRGPNNHSPLQNSNNYSPVWDPNNHSDDVGAKNFLPMRYRNNHSNDVGAKNFLPIRYRNNHSNNIRANNHSPLRGTSKTIGSVVRGFKIGVTKWFRQNNNMEIIWQRNYYEHIIRNEQSYETISNYILNNPAKWTDDKFYK